MRIVTPAARLRALGCNLALAGSAVMLASTLAQAEAAFVRGDTQYVAALGDSSATSGNDAATWGLWAVDPGPRGVAVFVLADKVDGHARGGDQGQHGEHRSRDQLDAIGRHGVALRAIASARSRCSVWIWAMIAQRSAGGIGQR